MATESIAKRNPTSAADGTLPADWDCRDDLSPGQTATAGILTAIKEQHRSRRDVDLETYTRLMVSLASGIVKDIGADAMDYARENATGLLVKGSIAQVGELLDRLKLTPETFAADLDETVWLMQRFPLRLKAERAAALVRQPRVIHAEIASGDSDLEKLTRAWAEKRATLQAEHDAATAAIASERSLGRQSPRQGALVSVRPAGDLFGTLLEAEYAKYTTAAG